jgi:hypothetical protein
MCAADRATTMPANTVNGQSPFDVHKRGINGGSQSFELKAATVVPMMSLSAAMIALMPQSCPSRKNRTIWEEASGPCGSVYVPAEWPPDQAWPAPSTSQYSTAGPAAGSVMMVLV